ncbi:TPA: phage tail protein [Klebsiella pneumoniae]|nr:phage tail protein [Klebsiella pneumoniae]HBR6228492.1 phage tail protein [Klebsiella pneumoniae]HCD6479452.1 phage tail protein [Klebsiella pneumoniae]HCD9221270.1 phage tail protein [Klebsiella pneumoniae]
MAGKKFSAILTGAGEAALAAAALSGVPVGFSVMAVGDGGGSLPEPNPEQTQLVNEVYRAPLNRLIIAEQGANIIRAEMLIPAQAGGFWLREAALYDDSGVCLAIANLPESYKPQLAEGSGRLHSVNLWIAVSNTADVELKADPSVILATVEEVNKAKAEAKDYADQITGQLDTDIQQAIANAIATARRDFWEEENPPGTVRFFAQNVDPNEKWPWSKWTYTGENKTIRVGKADGSNVGQTGGSDTVTIERANLPAVQIDVTGETSEQEEKTLTTKENGAHNHQGGDGAPGEQWREGTHGTDNQKDANFNLTSDAPAHSHDVVIPPHKHSTTGKTENLGEGKSFSLVEAHTLLMCWARVA